jgi:formylglycine-generating enzyme required for sulfatase activity
VIEILPSRDPIDAEAPVIAVQPQGAVYGAGDTARALTVSASVRDGGILSYQWYSNTVDSAEDGTSIFSAVGEAYIPPTKAKGVVYYYVIVTNTITGNNYGGNKTARAVSRTAGVGIDVVPVSITGLSVTSKIYDGTADAEIDGTAVIDGVNVGDKVTVIDGTALFNDKNAGTGKTVTFDGWSISGADAGNYFLSSQPANIMADITVKPVTITGLSAGNKVYDGTTAATVSGTAVINGIIPGDDVSAVVAAEFDDKNAGTGKTVTFGYSLGGADAGNYSLSAQPASVTANITAKPVSITGLSASNKQYNGTITAAVTGTAVISGKIAADTVTVNAGTAAFANASVGNGKTVTFSGWSLAGADAGNYSLSAQPASVTANIEFVSMIEMVWIPAGTFIMGSPASEPNRYTDETQHSVTLTSGFYMGKYQVTQAQWEAVTGKTMEQQQAVATTSTTDYGRGSNHPIYYVNWYDVVEFCNRLSVMEGLIPVYSLNGKTNPDEWGTQGTSWNDIAMDRSKNGYRLPTEAEWEYACRGSYENKATETNTKPFGIGDGTKMVSGMANFDVRYPYDLAHVPAGSYSDTGATGYVGKTTAVGSYADNNYGLYDMHGNVWEWCWDWYKSDITTDNTDPVGAVTGSIRVERGGSWYNIGQNLRSAYRYYGTPSFRDSLIGFRVVRS